MVKGVIKSLTIYPVKGLGAVELKTADLSPNAGLVNDRRFGLCRGAAGELAGKLASSWEPWEFCGNLQFKASLARIKIESYAAENCFVKMGIGEADWRGSLAQAEGRDSLGAFIYDHLGIVCEIADSSQTPLWDWGIQAPATIINAASVASICAKLGMPADPRRFRSNLLIDGWEAWAEREWAPGTRIALGAAELEVTRAITRCAATKVNPDTAEIDAQIPAALMKNFGHTECGLGVAIRRGGSVGIGDVAKVVHLERREVSPENER